MSEERHLFIADLHFGDDPVRRGHRKKFTSDEEHNNFIHNNILSKASTQKTLWILGDSFTKTREFWRLEKYREVFQQVNITLGNHCHKGLPRYALQFKNVNVFGSIKRFGLWLSHVPVPDYELYRGMNICGHRHTRGIPTINGFTGEEEEDWRYFCVSCENIDYTPISLKEIKELRYGWDLM
ncbi:hypothetical protein [Pseudoalteromonas phage PH357]|nr:hypothetical protein [Pseudoalteromonas phage PH357]